MPSRLDQVETSLIYSDDAKMYKHFNIFSFKTLIYPQCTCSLKGSLTK